MLWDPREFVPLPGKHSLKSQIVSAIDISLTRDHPLEKYISLSIPHDSLTDPVQPPSCICGTFISRSISCPIKFFFTIHHQKVDSPASGSNMA